MTTPDPRMRAADVDRQNVVNRLTDAFTAGRLTASEFDERVKQAYAATFLDEFPSLLADLPHEDHRSAAGWTDGDSYDEWNGNARYGAREASGAPYGRPDGRQRDWQDNWQRDWRNNWRRDWRDNWQREGRWGDHRRGFRRHRDIRVLPLLIAVLALLVLGHGFILIPVLWFGVFYVLFRRGHRRGGCGPRSGPRSTRYPRSTH
ncbi:MAG: DUF1707 domain-containing protein [Nakamurella sp.]